MMVQYLIILFKCLFISHLFSSFDWAKDQDANQQQVHFQKDHELGIYWDAIQKFGEKKLWSLSSSREADVISIAVQRMVS